MESFLHCKLKGHLILTGQQGVKSDYETMVTEKRADVRLAAIEKILADHPGEEIPRNVPLITSALKQGTSYVLDPTLEARQKLQQGLEDYLAGTTWTMAIRCGHEKGPL